MTAMKRTFADRGGLPWWYWRRKAERMERRSEEYADIDLLGSKLLAWWDSSFGVTITGAGVSSWRDRKFGHNVVQATDANRPTYSATSFNGSPGLSFNGTSQNLRMSPHPFPLDDGNIEIWATVANVEPAANAGNRFVAQFSGSSSLVRQTNNALNGIAGGSISGGGIISTNSRHVGRAVIQTGFVTGYMDGGSGSGAVAADPAITNVALCIGANNTGASAFWNGQIRDVLITRVLTTAQASQLSTFLLARRAL